MQPRNVSGSSTTLKISGTFRGSNVVPISSPNALPNNDANSRTKMNNGMLWIATDGAWFFACTTKTTGKTIPAASIDWVAPEQIFASPTVHTGAGASTRSSISFEYENSCTSGSATAWIPWNMIATAIRPGTRMVENDGPPATRCAGPMPCPILGKT